MNRPLAGPAEDNDLERAQGPGEWDRGAVEEVAPRDPHPAARLTGEPRPDSVGAVDENRPGDITAQDPPVDLPDSRIRTNVLQRQHAIVPGDRAHPRTAGEEIASE